jgi:hypothetical protein
MGACQICIDIACTLEPTLEGTKVVLDGRITGAGILGTPRPPTTSPPSPSCAACGRTWPP